MTNINHEAIRTVAESMKDDSILALGYLDLQTQLAAAQAEIERLRGELQVSVGQTRYLMRDQAVKFEQLAAAQTENVKLRGYLSDVIAGFHIPDEQPKTFGCHHVAETCPACVDMVSRWKVRKEVKEALAAQPCDALKARLKAERERCAKAFSQWDRDGRWAAEVIRTLGD